MRNATKLVVCLMGIGARTGCKDQKRAELSQITNPIIKGTLASDDDKKELRYIGKIISTDDRGESLGTGFLIACRRVILTAGHNIKDPASPRNNKFYPADDIETAYTAARIDRPRGYKNATNLDLALIKLDSVLPARYGEVNPYLVTTAEQPFYEIFRVDRPWNIAGYGVSTARGRPDGLRLGIGILSRTLRDHDATDDDNRKDMLFVKPGPKGTIAYNGDSGGPLVMGYTCHNDLVAGVDSAGTYGLTNKPEELYEAYVSIWRSRDWINTTVNDMCGERVYPQTEPQRRTDSRTSLSGGPGFAGCSFSVSAGADSSGCSCMPDAGTCVPRSCGPDECGLVYDSCGGDLDCGECQLPSPFCGDDVCNGEENCLTCPQDCGDCPAPQCASPSSCSVHCGPVTDDCDEVFYCGSCSPDCQRASCGTGTIPDGCGGIEYCGP